MQDVLTVKDEQKNGHSPAVFSDNTSQLGLLKRRAPWNGWANGAWECDCGRASLSKSAGGALAVAAAAAAV